LTVAFAFLWLWISFHRARPSSEPGASEETRETANDPWEAKVAALIDDASHRGLKKDGNHLLLLPHFRTNTTSIKSESMGELKSAVRWLQDHPEATRVLVAGYSDNRGAADYTLKLTRNRARALAHWFVDHGIDCKRLEFIGYGATRPICDAPTELQRRYEIDVIEVEGHSVIGDATDSGESACDSD
jgi:outer membrane protein OmpA-like peptidoglycan-associated protein